MPSTQRPWWHGSGEQSSTLSSHSVPSKPAGPEGQATPTCHGPAHSHAPNQSWLSSAIEAAESGGNSDPVPSWPPLHPVTSYKIRPRPRPSPPLNPTPSCDPVSNSYTIAQFCLSLNCKWGHVGGA